jgi:hypothetical protein
MDTDGSGLKDTSSDAPTEGEGVLPATGKEAEPVATKAAVVQAAETSDSVADEDDMKALQAQVKALTKLVTKLASAPDPAQAKPKGVAGGGGTVAEKVAHKTPQEVQTDMLVKSAAAAAEQEAREQRHAMEQLALYATDPTLREAAFKALKSPAKTG